MSSPPQAPPSSPSWPPWLPIAENLICIEALGSCGGKGEGPGDLLNQSWEARTGRRGSPAGAGGGRGRGGGGGADVEDSEACRTLTAPSLPPSAHPRVPTSLLPSLGAASLVLTSGVVLLPRLRVITSSHPRTRELSPPAPGSGGGGALPGRVFPGVRWGAVSREGLQGPTETPATLSLPPAGLPSGLGTLSPNHDRNEREGERTG